MLTRLEIQNYALISRLDIDFEQGFSVITGETGAGKSILLGALSLLLGARADLSVITDGESKCIIEGEFDISGYNLKQLFDDEGIEYSDSCIIRRELNASGKSRSFVNDTPAPLSLLRTLAGKLIDIHSQHEALLLNDDSFTLSLVDSLACNNAELNAYSASYEALMQAEAVLAKLRREAEEAAKNADYNAFQYHQLADAALVAGEMETLTDEQQRLAHAEDIAEALAQTDDALTAENGGIIPLLKDARNSLRRIAAYLPAECDIAERLESSYIELQDISDEVRHLQSSLDNNPSALERAEERLAQLQQLLRKFGKDTVEELIEERERYKSLIDRRDSFDFDISAQEKEVARLRKQTRESAQALHATRAAVIPELQHTLSAKLLRLGIRHAVVQIDLRTLPDFQPDGTDNAVMLFAANLNQTLRPVAESASGGELSRLMLAVKTVVAEKHNLPTLIFDEIDTGVSGEVAEEMAKMMLEISRNRQVITITHLPQIAAKGARHYRVYKQDTAQRTETHISLLTSDERVRETATLLSGAEVTQEALANARKLLGKQRA